MSADLRVLLSDTHAPDVLSGALHLAERGGAQERGAALQLLAFLPPDARSYAIARRLLGAERVPKVLAGAIMNLRPPGLTDEWEDREVVDQLMAIGRHPDPMVRAHRMQKLAEWDKDGSAALPEVLDGLTAPEVLVRQAAVGAVMIGELRSPALQAALVELLRRPGEDSVAKSGALQALERFSLRSDERAVCLAAQRELERAAGAGGSGARALSY